jgi:hypothetical protein
MLAWIAYYSAFVIPVFVQAYGAWLGGFLTPGEMEAHGVTKGLPFIAHLGMWSDVTLFGALMATILKKHASQWEVTEWAIALAVGLVVSAAMHWGFYVRGAIPEAHVRDGMVTYVGIIHFVYMAVGLAIVMLFYTCSANVTTCSVLAVSGLLFAHVVLGTLIPLKIWAKIYKPLWYPVQPVINTATFITLVVVVLLLIGSSLWAVRRIADEHLIGTLLKLVRFSHV